MARIQSNEYIHNFDLKGTDHLVILFCFSFTEVLTRVQEVHGGYREGYAFALNASHNSYLIQNGCHIKKWQHLRPLKH